MFVGGFGSPKDGSTGGQVFACNSLLKSPLSNFVEWILVDSTQRSTPPPPLLVRSLDGITRVVRVLWHLCFSRIDAVLVFTSMHGLSLYEKGLICIFGKVFRKRVLLSTRSHPHLPSIQPGFFRRYVNLVCKMCDVIICQSELGKKDLAELFDVPLRKISVVPNWIDVTQFHPEPITRDRDVSGKCRLCYLGWLDPIKGLNFLLHAIRTLKSRRDDFELTLIGGGCAEAELRALAKDLQIQDVVQFKGWVVPNSVRHELNQCDVFVFPSLHEGMPNSLLQAMACGLPVIASNVTSIPEVVENNKNGLLVPARSSEAISDAIEHLLDNPEKRIQMRKNNLSRVASLHCIDATWPRIAELLGIDAGG